jgi:hypothetical protein
LVAVPASILPTIAARSVTLIARSVCHCVTVSHRSALHRLQAPVMPLDANDSVGKIETGGV